MKNIPPDKADLSLNLMGSGKPIKGKFRPRRSVPALIKLKKRISMALQLRLAGMSYEAIGDGIDAAGLGSCEKSTAYDLVMKGLALYDRQCEESVEKLRQIESARLDRLQNAWWGDAIGGVINGKVVNKDIKSAGLVRGIIEQRAKMNGLYPKGENNPTGGTTNVNILIATSERARNLLAGISKAVRDRGEAPLAIASPSEAGDPGGQLADLADLSGPRMG